jgi:hypothetical protein
MENYPFIFFSAGILLIVMAANGGYSKLGIYIVDPTWRWFMGGLGFLLIQIAVICYLFEMWNRSKLK